MLLSQQLPLLRTLGVPQSELERPRRVLVHPNGVWHAPTSSCISLEAMEDSEDVQLPLTELTPETECLCLSHEDEYHSTPWMFLKLLTDAHYAATRPDHLKHSRPERQAVLYRNLEREKRDLQIQHAGLMPVVAHLQEAVDTVYAALDQRLAQVLERLQSPETRQDFPRRSTVSQGMFLVALSGFYLFPASRPTEIDAVILSFGQEATDRCIVLVPGHVKDILCFWAQKEVARISSATMSVHRLAEEDTPAVTETAMSLWDPFSPGPLQVLTQAVSAARAVCT